MSRNGQLAGVVAVVALIAGWLFFPNHGEGPVQHSDTGTTPPAIRIDGFKAAQEQEAENRKTQARIAELARIEAQRTQQQQATAANQRARAALQNARNGAWSTFISNNWSAYLELRQSAIESSDHSAACTLCDGSGLMDFCLLCEGDGKCPACHGTGKTFGDELCAVCLGKGLCYLCFGKGTMPCPFCDDGTVYTSLPFPPASLPMVGAAQSRPATPREFAKAAQQPLPAVASAQPSGQVSASQTAAPPPEESGRGFASTRSQMVAALAFILIGIVGLPRVAPAIGKLLNGSSDTLPAAAAAALQIDVLAEDKAFSAFVANLQSKATEPKPLPSLPEPRQPLEEQIPVAQRLTKYFETCPRLFAGLRDGFVQLSGGQTDQATLVQLVRQVTSLKNLSDVPQLLPLNQLSAGVEGLLRQLAAKSSNITASAIRTAASAVDLLESLSRADLKRDLVMDPPVRLLIVDDDPVNRTAMSMALKKAFSRPDTATGGESALTLAATQAYDAIFLDVEMPGMDGYELCRRIHELPRNQTTPVIFVTRHHDFTSRAKSFKSGGMDLIAKPFLAFEITVKALTLVLRGRLQQDRDEVVAARAQKALTLVLRNRLQRLTQGAAPCGVPNPEVAAANSVANAPPAAKPENCQKTGCRESSHLENSKNVEASVPEMVPA